jgi:hypothetical protein
MIFFPKSNNQRELPPHIAARESQEIREEFLLKGREGGLQSKGRS